MVERTHLRGLTFVALPESVRITSELTDAAAHIADVPRVATLCFTTLSDGVKIILEPFTELSSTPRLEESTKTEQGY